MSKFPSLPLFTDAFLADTGHLNAQESGAYMLLLMMAWRSPECCLPDDDAKLSRWARVDARTWRRIKPTVMSFWSLAEGRWTQKRLTDEYEIVSKRAELARENGKQGGRPKPLKPNEQDNPVGSSRVTQTKAPNPNPSPIEEVEGEDARAREAKNPGLITTAATTFSDAILRSIGIDPHDPPPNWYGFPYSTSICVDRGYDVAACCAIAAEISAKKPKLPAPSYFMAAFETLQQELAARPKTVATEKRNGTDSIQAAARRIADKFAAFEREGDASLRGGAGGDPIRVLPQRRCQ